jgi:hypothetical protein
MNQAPSPVRMARRLSAAADPLTADQSFFHVSGCKDRLAHAGQSATPAGLPLVVAGPGAVLAAPPPGGPSQAVPGAVGWLSDQRAEQRGDLVAGQRDLAGCWQAPGVLGGGGDGEEGQGEHGQGGPPIPGVPAADLMFIQPASPLASAKQSSIPHLAPATAASSGRVTGRADQQRKNASSRMPFSPGCRERRTSR